VVLVGVVVSAYLGYLFTVVVPCFLCLLLFFYLMVDIMVVVMSFPNRVSKTEREREEEGKGKTCCCCCCCSCCCTTLLPITL